MIKRTAVSLLIAHAIFLFAPGFSQDKVLRTMTVTVVKNSTLVAGKGSDYGITPDMEFSIIRVNNNKEYAIGEAKVVLVKNNRCGLRVTNLTDSELVKVGDLLREKEIEDDLALLQETEDIAGQKTISNAPANSAVVATKNETASSDDRYVQSLETRLKEKEKDESHNSGLLTGVGICCGIYLIASLVLYADQQNK